MPNTLTYDPTELPEGEFTAEEQDSLQVGERLAEEQNQLLAGKFRDAQELEQAYVELQRKLGSRDTEEPEAETATEPDTEEVNDEQVDVSPGVALIQEASAEYYNNGKQLSAETIEKFSQMSSQDLVAAYIEMQANQPDTVVQNAPDLSQADVNQVQNSVGGEAAYSNLVRWASENLPEDAVNAFDSVVESGNLQAIKLAVAGLQREYEGTVGYEGRMLTGKAAKPVEGFRSQAEVVRAMQDVRYDNDPAYRQDVFDKLERSNINF